MSDVVQMLQQVSGLWQTWWADMASMSLAHSYHDIHSCKSFPHAELVLVLCSPSKSCQHVTRLSSYPYCRTQQPEHIHAAPNVFMRSVAVFVSRLIWRAGGFHHRSRRSTETHASGLTEATASGEMVLRGAWRYLYRGVTSEYLQALVHLLRDLWLSGLAACVSCALSVYFMVRALRASWVLCCSSISVAPSGC